MTHMIHFLLPLTSSMVWNIMIPLTNNSCELILKMKVKVTTNRKITRINTSILLVLSLNSFLKRVENLPPKMHDSNLDILKDSSVSLQLDMQKNKRGAKNQCNLKR